MHHKSRRALPALEETERLQQRMKENKKLASVAKQPSETQYRPDIPQVVFAFRETIKQLKKRIFDMLDENTEDKHNPKHLKHSIAKILQLGAVLRHILGDRRMADAQPAQETVDSLKALFGQNGVDFDQLGEQEKSKCLYYVDVDIFWFTYSSSQAHTNSLAAIRK